MRIHTLTTCMHAALGTTMCKFEVEERRDIGKQLQVVQKLHTCILR